MQDSYKKFQPVVEDYSWTKFQICYFTDFTLRCMFPVLEDKRILRHQMFALIINFSTVFVFININKHKKNTSLALFPEEASETWNWQPLENLL